MGKFRNRKYTSEFKQQASELAMKIGSRKAAEQPGFAMQNIDRWNHTRHAVSIETPSMTRFTVK